MTMWKVFVTNHIEYNAVIVTARDEYDRVLAEHMSILDCDRDVTGALLVSLIDVMHKLSAGNNIKLVDFDPAFTNKMVYRCRVWRKFDWNVTMLIMYIVSYGKSYGICVGSTRFTLCTLWLYHKLVLKKYLKNRCLVDFTHVCA